MGKHAKEKKDSGLLKCCAEMSYTDLFIILYYSIVDDLEAAQLQKFKCLNFCLLFKLI